MKKRLGEFTLDETKEICKRHSCGCDCPLFNKTDTDNVNFRCMRNLPSKYDTEIEIADAEEEK